MWEATGERGELFTICFWNSSK